MPKKQKFKISDYVWAKMKGYPPWPGRIIGSKKQRCYVYFFGSENYGWVPMKDLYPYKKFVDEFSSSVKLPALKKAVADISKCFEEKRIWNDESDDEDIPLSQVVSSISEEDLPLSSFVKNKTVLSDKLHSKSKIQIPDEMRYVSDKGVCKLARIKHTKRLDEDDKNIVSVSINDEISINNLIPKDLRVCISRCC